MKKALVVDDNSNNLTLEKDLLEIAGFEVLYRRMLPTELPLPEKKNRI